MSFFLRLFFLLQELFCFFSSSFFFSPRLSFFLFSFFLLFFFSVFNFFFSTLLIILNKYIIYVYIRVLKKFYFCEFSNVPSSNQAAKQFADGEVNLFDSVCIE